VVLEEVTNRDEKSALDGGGIQRNGRPEWIRTIDLFRVNSPTDDGEDEKE